MRRWARGCAPACLALGVAGALLVLLAHDYTRTRARETNDPHTNTVSDVLVLSTYTDAAVGGERYLRWARSAALWGARGETLGEASQWSGHGVKLNLLRGRLRGMVEEGRGEQLVLYTDSYDVMFVGPLREVSARFQRRGDARVLFSTETACYPDEDAAARYPRVATGYRYLNAGLVIGYASSLYELLSLRAVRDCEDDQRYYTEAYLNATIRERLRLRLDHKAEIFQSLFNVSDDVRVVSEAGAWAHVENSLTGSRPLVLHGNGLGEYLLWDLESALVRAWTTHPELAPRDMMHQELEELADLYGLVADDAGDAGDA